MKQPCKNCPFKKSNEGFGLRPAKAESILEAITRDKSFHCHETVDYSNEDFEGNTDKSKLCFGAALFLENTVESGCRSNFAFRIGLMKKEFTLQDLRQDYDLIYGSFKEFLKGVTF
jgi:hypothetical protein